MSELACFVAFRLDRHRYALPLNVVERVVRAAEVTALPHAPAVVIGAVNVHGRVLPVLNLRRRFLVPERRIVPADWFLLARTVRRTVVLAIDEADGLIERPSAEILPSEHIAPGLDAFPGVVRMPDGLILIHDIDRCLSLDEDRMLDTAMQDLEDA